MFNRPKVLHQLEGLTALGICAALYSQYGEGWLLAVALFFAPDLALLTYAFSGTVGNSIYNMAHTYTLPAILASIGVLMPQPLLWSIALIWAAHIGFDRMLGLGLRSPGSLNYAQLRRVGRAPA
jgi:hypothetical protein